MKKKNYVNKKDVFLHALSVAKKKTDIKNSYKIISYRKKKKRFACNAQITVMASLH